MTKVNAIAARRRKARHYGLQALYQWSFCKSDAWRIEEEFQSDNEYYMRESRIDKLQIYASKQADQTFKGDKRKIAKIKGELSYTAGQGDYFSQDQVDKWWKKYK